MKIVITSQGTDLNSEVDPRFGRCQYFILYDTDTESFEALENLNVSAGGGAGIRTAQTIAEKGPDAVITGNIGPNAFRALSAAEIQIYAGVSGRIADAITHFKDGTLKPYGAPSVESHFGITATPVKTPEPSHKIRIAVASEDDLGMESNVSAHFGRCPYYTMVEAEGDKISLSYKVENPFYGAHGNPGQVPAFIRDQGANVIIAGGMGQRAVGFFNEFGIEVVTGTAGKVKSVIDGYLKGAIKGASPCNHDSYP